MSSLQMLWLHCFARSNKVIFSHSGISCLLPISTKQQQVNLLADKEGKISDSVQLPTIPSLFISLPMTSKEHKFLLLIKSNLSIVSFVDRTFMSQIKILCTIPGHTQFFPVLSSKTFTVWGAPGGGGTVS